MKLSTSVFTGVLVASCVLLSAASSINYDHHEQDGFEPVATIDSDSLTHATDKEYLVQKTASLVDLFYETGLPKRIAKFARYSETLLENKNNDPMINDVNEIFEGRKKDKGGLGAILMMGMMMAKMVGAMKMAAIGALAAKALGVSLMALMLSAIIGLKKLAEGGHGGGGGEHHRRRRDLNEPSKDSDDPFVLAYRAWQNLE